MSGARVAVVTIDPAKRLADALGLDDLDDEPRRVDPALFDGMKGELHALMLDSKRTFDALIERVAPDARARDEVLNNRIYQELSSAVAGSQEFTAIAKLYELDQSGRFDVLVLDTPPSRNALDFLDAPDRLTGFLQGRAIRMFIRPGRILGAGTGLVFSALRKATGVALLDDLSTFFKALGSMIPDLAERGTHVKEMLSSPQTTFLLVTSLEREPVEETVFFWEHLRDLELPFGGVVVNKLRAPVTSTRAPAGLDPDLAPPGRAGGDRDGGAGRSRRGGPRAPAGGAGRPAGHRRAAAGRGRARPRGPRARSRRAVYAVAAVSSARMSSAMRRRSGSR